MSCCGQRRQAWRQYSRQSSTSAIVQTSEIPEPVVQNPVLLYHLAEGSLVVKGTITGITYLFGGRGSSLNVDERDVPAFVATGVFATDPDRT